MINKALLGLILILVLSCADDSKDETEIILVAKGSIWLSGGLANCAEQIHLDQGDTLIVSIEDILNFRSGDRVNVYYKEIGVNQFCPPHLDCEIIGLTKID
jgi:hypothetical protein